jgi:hypothetical protein
MNFNGKVREIKTSRSFYEPSEPKDLAMYCEQVLIYLAGTGQTEGDIWCLYMNIPGGPAFRVYKLKISKADLAKVQVEIALITKTFKKAQKEKKPEILPLCRPFRCHPKECAYFEKCKPQGRYGVPRTHWAKDITNPLLTIGRTK